VRKIRGRRLPDASGEPRGERRPGQAAHSGRLLDCPVAAGVSVDSARGQTDLRVECTGRPVRLGVLAGGPGAQNLDVCRLPMSAKPIEKARRGQYTAIRSPLRRTPRSSAESKSPDPPSTSRRSEASSNAGRPAGRSARSPGRRAMVAAHPSD
jgi:hypothetical protein